MISSVAARRRYFERSSLTFASATVVGCARFVEPPLRRGFGDDGEVFDRTLGNVIEHPDIVDAQTVLRLLHPAQALDAALADLRRSEPKVALHGVAHLAPLAG